MFGFKFQQRPSANNGIVRQYGYRALDAEGNVLEEKHGIASTDAERVGGGWITVTFDGKSKAAMNVKVIEIFKTGSENICCLTFVKLFRRDCYCDSVFIFFNYKIIKCKICLSNTCRAAWSVCIK